jgi:hypothetical protein
MRITIIMSLILLPLTGAKTQASVDNALYLACEAEVHKRYPIHYSDWEDRKEKTRTWQPSGIIHYFKINLKSGEVGVESAQGWMPKGRASISNEKISVSEKWGDGKDSQGWWLDIDRISGKFTEGTTQGGEDIDDFYGACKAITQKDRKF